MLSGNTEIHGDEPNGQHAEKSVALDDCIARLPASTNGGRGGSAVALAIMKKNAK